MRVLLVSKEFEPFSPGGGIGTYTQILAEALGQAGVETHVLCVHPGLPRAAHDFDCFTLHTGPLLQPRGVGRVSGLPAAWGRLTQGFSVWREYRALDKSFDVVEAPELYAEALFIARFTNVPLVVRLHSSAEQLFPYLGRHGRDLRATVRLENEAIRRADIVVSTAPNLAESIPKLGLNSEFTRPIIYPVRRREPNGTERDSNLVLFAGRLEARKNPEVLIEAAARVLLARPQTRFRLAGSDTGTGDGSYLAQLQELARSVGVLDAVEFTGALGHEQVITEMSRAAVCAFPSRWESFGLVVAEAGSIGRPVVVSDIPAFRDFVEDGVSGRIVPADSPDEWAAALVELLGDDVLSQAIGARLRAEIVRRADPAHVAGLALESYQAAIDRRRQRRGGLLDAGSKRS